MASKPRKRRGVAHGILRQAALAMRAHREDTTVVCTQGVIKRHRSGGLPFAILVFAKGGLLLSFMPKNLKRLPAAAGFLLSPPRIPLPNPPELAYIQ